MTSGHLTREVKKPASPPAPNFLETELRSEWEWISWLRTCAIIGSLRSAVAVGTAERSAPS